MSNFHTQVQNLNYNAAEQKFEALVIFHEGAEARKFPVAAALPLTADFAQVTRVLVARAKDKRAKSSAHLTSRVPAQRGPRLVHINALIGQIKDAVGLRNMPHAA